MSRRCSPAAGHRSRRRCAIGDWYLGPGGRWIYDPDAPDPGTSPAPTRIQPVVPPRSERDVAALHGDEDFSGDVGDWIDPNAPDPTGLEINDPAHPDHVRPWRPGASR